MRSTAVTIEGTARTVFDYSGMANDAAIAARAAAGRIQRRTAKQIEAIIETGRDLVSIKAMLDHGQFTAWATAELGMSIRSIQNYMSAANLFGNKSATVAHLSPTAIYSLTSPSLPDEARAAIVGRIETERLGETEVLDLMAEARSAAKQAELAITHGRARRSLPAKKQQAVPRARTDAANKALTERQSRDEAIAEAAAILRDALADRLPQLIDALDQVGRYNLPLLLEALQTNIKGGKMSEREDWYWAAASDEPAGDKFIIASGTDELWSRVRREINANEDCAWNALHRGHEKATTDDVLDLILTVILPYRVNQNRFVLEAAKIPVFARFLRSARSDLGNYVSNPIHPEPLLPVARYSRQTTQQLGEAVSNTLGIETDWFEV